METGREAETSLVMAGAHSEEIRDSQGDAGSSFELSHEKGTEVPATEYGGISQTSTELAGRALGAKEDEGSLENDSDGTTTLYPQV